MQVNKCLNFALGTKFLQVLTNGKDLWVQKLARVIPFTINVNPSQITSKVAINNTVNINHWKEYESEVVS
jgi:hypothetical protein